MVNTRQHWVYSLVTDLYSSLKYICNDDSSLTFQKGESKYCQFPTDAYGNSLGPKDKGKGNSIVSITLPIIDNAVSNTTTKLTPSQNNTIHLPGYHMEVDMPMMASRWGRGLAGTV